MAKKRNRKVYTNGENPNIEGVFTPDGYKSQALDVITKRQEDEPAARLMAPPDYVFPAEDSTLQIITARIGGNNVISQVMQIDKRAFRVLWSRYQEETAEISKEQKTELQAALDWQLAKLKPNIDIHEDGTANTLTRIGVFFGVLGQLIDSRAFPARSTVDEFLESAVSFLYEKDDLWFWIGRWQDIARAGRELVKERKPKSDILDKPVLLDSTTHKNTSRWIGVRGAFTEVQKFKWDEDILKSEEQALGRKLTKDERINVLKREKEYLMKSSVTPGEIIVISDRWGDFSISASVPQLFAVIKNEERRRDLEERLKNPELFDTPEFIAGLNAELSKIILYQNAAKIYRMSAVYYYNTRDNHLKIPKEEALKYFGFDPGDRGAYTEIERAGWAIYNASVILRGKFRGELRFWSKFVKDHKYYYIDFIPDVWPATRELVESYGKERTPESLEILQERRYFKWPPRLDAAGLSAYGDYYTGFILRETGNKKIKDVPEGQKVIARTGADHCAEANIQDSKSNRRKQSMIETWREIMKNTNIITDIKPSIKTLEGWKPGRFSKTQIHVYATSDADAINQYLKERQQKKSTNMSNF